MMVLELYGHVTFQSVSVQHGVGDDMSLCGHLNLSVWILNNANNSTEIVYISVPLISSEPSIPACGLPRGNDGKQDGKQDA